MNVAILGCGPAGMMAAHAATVLGHDVTIYADKKEPSPIFGAMYLHREIPHITAPSDRLVINVIKSGTREGYAINVYGRAGIDVSWDKFEAGETIGWSLSETYARLWMLYWQKIKVLFINAMKVDRIRMQHDLVFSTIPAPAICTWDHIFEKQDIWIIHGFGYRLINGVNDDNIMYYNGYPPDGRVERIRGFDWYRFSQINNYQSWEYSRPPLRETLDNRQILSRGMKPLRTDCDCHPDVIRLGRFGKWERGVLTHHAYEDTYNALLKMQ